MNSDGIGTCQRHKRQFNLREGCPLCLAEKNDDYRNPVWEEQPQELPLTIVKVKYYSETTGKLGSCEYTYYSEGRLKVGNIVIVPVRDTTCQAMVSTVDVPEAEIAAFKDKMKTIPTGSVVETDSPNVLPKYFTEISEIKLEADYPHQDSGISGNVVTTLLLGKPESNPEIQAFYQQALALRDFAIARVILTNEDLEPANDDLILIRRVKKAMDEKRKEYLKPFQDHVKETNEAYKTLMQPIEEADTVTAGKMLTFGAEQERKIREAEAIEADKLALARREAELNSGEITVDLTPIKKPEPVPDRIRTGMGMSSQRDNWQWEIVDINQVPREYLMVNAGMLTPIVKASKGRLTIPGIRIYNKPIIAYR